MSKEQRVIEAFHAGAVVNIVYHNKVSKSTRKDQRVKVECTIESLNLSKPYFGIKTTDGKYRTFRWEGLHTITYK